jgi:hypothetical protein
MLDGLAQRLGRELLHWIAAMGWQSDGEHGALMRFALNVDGAAMRLDDPGK